MIELQRSTARRLIGREVHVVCLDGELVDGHLDWCSDNDVAVASGPTHRIIPLHDVVGMVRLAG